nr:hypothetical protein [Tanacetum cinerariifolium]
MELELEQSQQGSSHKVSIRNTIIRQRVGDLQLGIKSYQTKLNLIEPRWDASDFLFKEDYAVISKPRVVIYKDKDDQKKMLRENEVSKFSDGSYKVGDGVILFRQRQVHYRMLILDQHVQRNHESSSRCY